MTSGEGQTAFRDLPFAARDAVRKCSKSQVAVIARLRRPTITADASTSTAAAAALAAAAAAAAAAAYATLVVGGCELEKAHLMTETIRAHPYSPELEKAHLMKVIRSCG